MPETTTAPPPVAPVAIGLPAGVAVAGTQSSHSQPIKNLRVTFWGVQGSCPIFPTNREVMAYARQIAADAIRRAAIDLSGKLASGEATADYVRRLGGTEAAAEYQQWLGLPDLPVYGGETTCVEVETSDGDILVFDMGSGLREFSSTVLRKWANRRNRVLHLFGSHEHLDHRSGLPFAGFVFAKVEPFTLNIHGTDKFLTTLDSRYGMFSRELTLASHADDPLDYRMMAATFKGIEIRRPHSIGAANGKAAGGKPPPWRTHDVTEPIHIGRTTVTPFEVFHGVTDCLAYKVRHGDVTFVFCTDHELRHGDDPTDARQAKSMACEATLIEQCWDVDLGYFDGQYFRSEYEGLRGIGLTPPVTRVGWGHGCIEDCVARARKCRVKHALIGHHDPERQWDERVHLDRELGRSCAGDPCRIELAKQGQTVDL